MPSIIGVGLNGLPEQHLTGLVTGFAAGVFGLLCLARRSCFASIRHYNGRGGRRCRSSTNPAGRTAACERAGDASASSPMPFPHRLVLRAFEHSVQSGQSALPHPLAQFGFERVVARDGLHCVGLQLECGFGTQPSRTISPASECHGTSHAFAGLHLNAPIEAERAKHTSTPAPPRSFSSGHSKHSLLVSEVGRVSRRLLDRQPVIQSGTCQIRPLLRTTRRRALRPPPHKRLIEPLQQVTRLIVA